MIMNFLGLNKTMNNNYFTNIVKSYKSISIKIIIKHMFKKHHTFHSVKKDFD